MGAQVDVGILDVYVKLGLISGNILVTIFAVCGNAVAVVVAFKSRLTSSPTKMCLISLSVSDLLLTATTTPVDLDQLMDSLHAWHLGKFLCRFLPFAQCLFLLVNSFSLLAMTLQRYWSTSSLLASRIYNRAEKSSKLMTAIIFSFIWLIPSGFTMPYLDVYSLTNFNCTTNTSDIMSLDSGAATEIVFLNKFITNGPTNIIHSSGEIMSKQKIYCFSVNNSEPVDSPTEIGERHHWGSRPDASDLDKESLFSSRIISMCQQTTVDEVALYHTATGILFVIVFIAYFWGYHFFQRMKGVQANFEKILVPIPIPIIISGATVTTETSRTITNAQVRNVELLSEIRKMLARQRRGIKLIQRLILIFVVFRMPIWIYTVLEESAEYKKNRCMLSIYFCLHLLASVKGAVTPFLYCHASQSMRSTDSNIKFCQEHGEGGRSSFTLNGSNRSRGSDLSNSNSTSTTITAYSEKQIIINECIAQNSHQIRSAMKMTQPIEFLRYLRCGCFNRKKSSIYVLDGT